ncbi:ANTAR domain-containing protein [Streptomyces erythrochromogenes]|uniref:ANTAR domain-containing protein n=1 Tax=Streptomyces erythrochromogenes TaxID=285574 RepID=UPI00362E4379
MTHDVVPPDEGASPEVLALAKVVARLRSEIADLEGVAASTAVLERAKGVLMAQTGISADAAYERLLERAAQRGRTLMEECWLALGQVRPRRARTGGARCCPASRRAWPRRATRATWRNC